MGRKAKGVQAAAVVALLAALTACGNDASADVPSGAIAEAGLTPTVDPNAFYDVPYGEYAEAAMQTGIAQSALVDQEGFSAGLADLCDNTPEQYAALVETLRSDAQAAEDPVHGLDARVDEVDLRVSMACRYRMSDWLDARGALEAEDTEGYATVTPDDEIPAEGEEEPDVGAEDGLPSDGDPDGGDPHGSDPHGSDPHGDGTEQDPPAGESTPTSDPSAEPAAPVVDAPVS